MMSLACTHCPSMFGCPSFVRLGLKFGSSFGGFRGSIQPGGGGFFGGGGPCAAMRAAAATMIVLVSTKAIPAPTDGLTINAPRTLLGYRVELVVERVTLVLE